MSQVYTSQKEGAIPIFFVTAEEFSAFQKQLSVREQQWLEVWNFQANAGQVSVLAEENGEIKKVICGVSKKRSMWVGAQAARGVPKGYVYTFENVKEEDFFPLALAWGLEQYEFGRYKTGKVNEKKSQLYVQQEQLDTLTAFLEVSYQVRDWINTPACDLTPEAFTQIAVDIAHKHGAKTHMVQGKDLEKNYPLVQAVGKASVHSPRVVDIRWGNAKHPKVTLVGKGVTFDTGGLDIKSAHNMFLMKKDMGGAAQALGLADLIMRMKLPLQVRVLLPLAENAISGNAYRPSDVVASRKGLTVEIGDTDAEGRLLLADALTAACEDNPDYLFDFATLTGAARVAVGTELSAFFSTHKEVSEQLKGAAEEAQDFVWELPLWEDYTSMLKSSVADITSCSSGGYAGAITAALFLKNFVSENTRWVHFDLMAWNVRSKPGRPEGGEVMGLRAVYEFLRRLS
jgi:leucyl aminopeptidase